jgi:hypothetical protein
MIREGAQGGQNKDILSSQLVRCSAILNFMFAVLSFGNNTAIAPLWIQALWLMYVILSISRLMVAFRRNRNMLY